MTPELMAETAVALVQLLSHLSKILTDEAQFLNDVRNSVENLGSDYRILKRFLRNEDGRQHDDEAVLELLRELWEVAYDMEDILDKYDAEVSHRNGGELRYASKLKEIGVLRQIGPKIHNILRSYVGLLQSYSIIARTQQSGEGPSSSSNSNSNSKSPARRTFSHLVEDDFVGLEEEIDTLVSLLVSEDSNSHQFIAICGMGGQGKSTIARKIYHHSDIRRHFDAFAWACITQSWETRTVLLEILVKLVPERIEQIRNMIDVELVAELYRVQLSKRCLVVLDDIWSQSFWNNLRPAFPCGKMAGKILLTARNKKVCKEIYQGCFIQVPRFLNAEESWELLQKKAFPRNKDMKIPDEMETIGRKLAKQCRGLPLATIVLGGLLMTKPTVDDWNKVHQKLVKYLGSGRNLGEYQNVSRVLALSYHDLPNEFKQCFLYLGNFPEDYDISTRKLYQLWAAEGLLPLESLDDDEDTLLDIAEPYLGDLAERCMVQVKVDESTARFKSCRLHDLMRDLCLQKGRERNFVNVITRQSNESNTSVLRRLSVTVDCHLEGYFPPKHGRIEHVRSVLFFSALTSQESLQASLELICNRFTFIRVLDLESFNFGEKLPKAIGNLALLRYLSLRDCQFSKLPPSIGNLKRLQTLDLRVHFFSYLTMPDVIWKLENLSHLYLPPSHRKTYKLQLGSLSKLEELKNFDTQVCDFRDLMKFTKLRKLSAILSLDMDELEEIISYLGGPLTRLRDSSFRIYYRFCSEEELALLKKLLECHHLRKLDLIGHIDKLPEDRVHFSQTLTKFTLRGSGLKEDPMPALQSLHNLQVLSLRGNVFSAKEMRCAARGFSQLKTLKLQGLPGLEEWSVDEGALPKLNRLEIDGCHNLKMLPYGLVFVSRLQQLVITNMPKEFNRRLQVLEEVEGEEFYKVKHIPSITIFDTTKRPARQSKMGLSEAIRKVFRSLEPVYPTLIPRKWQCP